MATINLIPDYLKKEQSANQFSGLIFSSLFVLLIMGILIFGAFFFGNYFVEGQLKETNQSLSEQELRNANLKAISEDVKLINSKLKKISTIKDSRLDWNKFLADLNSSVPEKVQITSLQADRKTKKVTIIGRAETRREIVKLQKKLETLDYFKNLTFNASSLNEEDQDYTFNLTGDFVK